MLGKVWDEDMRRNGVTAGKENQWETICVWISNTSSAQVSKQFLSAHVSTCFEARTHHHMPSSKGMCRQHMFPSTKGRNTKGTNVSNNKRTGSLRHSESSAIFHQSEGNQ
jgi:hypothetical protein